jgi:hypothetical protein
MIAVALSVAVQAAVLGAPLVHAHPDDHATTHHSGRAVHSHWGGHTHVPRSSAAALSDDDHDRAIFLSAFVAVAASAVTVPHVAQAVFELLVPAERAAHRGVEVVRSHDPPVARSRSPRAPPTLPVLI